MKQKHRKTVWEWLIPNADQVENPAVRTRYGVLAGIFGIVCNAILFAGKITAGLLANSIAVVADAFNNLSDAGSALVTVVGFHLAGKPADKEHPFGHGRIEYVSGLIVSFVILIVGFELFTGSVEKIRTPESVQSNALTVGILLFSIAGKLGMGLVYRAIGKKIHSPSLMASMTDSISDVISTAAVLLSVLIAMQFRINLDGWFGAAVAVFVFIAGLKTLKDTMDPLLGQAPDSELVDEIREKVLSYEGVLGIHDLMVHNYGPNRYLASMHAEVSAEANIMESHDLMDRIERDVQKEMNILLVLHMDPIESENETVCALREMTEEILHTIHADLSCHDFRIVNGPKHTNLIYDVLVPFSVTMTHEQLRTEIQKRTAERMENCTTVVTFDTSFTGEA